MISGWLETAMWVASMSGVVRPRRYVPTVDILHMWAVQAPGRPRTAVA